MPSWQELGDYVELLNLDGIEFRSYQFNIIKSIIEHGNTLVVLPTGLGKTLIGVALVAKAVHEGKRALFLAPTKPLVEQHYAVISKLLKPGNGETALLTGSISKKERIELEQKAKVIVATPQTIANDLREGAFSLQGFGVAVFDECHHAVGKYAYTYIANELAVRNVLIVGLTASPGSKPERVMALVEALNIRHIEFRTSMDSDVVEYIMPKFVHTVPVELSPTIEEIVSLLRPVGEESLKSLREMGLLGYKSFETIPRGKLIEIGNEIKKISASGYRFGALFSYIKLLHVYHAYDLVTTEGLAPFKEYIDSLNEREHKSRPVASFLKNPSIKEAVRKAEEAISNGEEHPKVWKTIDILERYNGKSGIVFAQYRSTVKMLVEKLRQKGIDAHAFVGKKEGVTQEQQKKVIEDFRQGLFKVLVASSIGEEGLDIPAVDFVVFYEPIPNEIRNIQRKGRTGRFRAGDVFILVTKDTKDVIYFFVSRSREKKMTSLLESINKRLKERYSLGAGQTRLLND